MITLIHKKVLLNNLKMKIAYRPEIDGLRGLAVLSVVFYHAKISIFDTIIFKGGYVGVDIFFVISGYLISSIILKELIFTKKFSLKNFYERRVRRIIPALLFIILVSLPFSWLILLPTSLIDFAKSLISSLFFISNYFFWLTESNYFGDAGIYKPFLHTWSLSIEEQYYVIFPIFFYLLFKYLKKYLLIILSAIFIISLILSTWTSLNNPSASFYFIHTRIWELFTGSIISCLSIFYRNSINDKKICFINSTFGLILIIFYIFFFKEYFIHPSFYSLLLILSVGSVIFFSNEDSFVTKLLSSKILVGVGLISYSLYLWHFPIFAYVRTMGFFDNSFFGKFLCIAVSILLSIFTYFFIEKPARDRKYKFKNILFIIIIVYSFIILFSYSIILKEGFTNRLPDILKKSNLNNEINILKDEYGKECFQNITGCRFNIESKKKIFLIGDSQMGVLAPILKNELVNLNYQFVNFTVGACIYFPDFNLVNLKYKRINESCNNDYFYQLKKILLQESGALIIFGGRFPVYFSNELYNRKDTHEGEWEYSYESIKKNKVITEVFTNEVLELSKKNKIILIYPIPEIGFDPLKKIWNTRISIFSNKKNNLKISTSFKDYQDRAKISFETLNQIRGKNIYRFYPHELFCNTEISERCLVSDENNILYSDNNHPSKKGAEIINKKLIEKIKRIF